jgi:hypothetical protein
MGNCGYMKSATGKTAVDEVLNVTAYFVSDLNKYSFPEINFHARLWPV